MQACIQCLLEIDNADFAQPRITQ